MYIYTCLRYDPCLIFQDNLDAAIALLRRTVDIDEKVYGSDHPELAMGLNSLGELLDMQARIPR